MAKPKPTRETVSDIFGAETGKPPWANEPEIKVPGDFRRKGKNGPPMVPDPSPDADLVKSGERKGRPKLVVYARPSGYSEILENTYSLTKWEQRCAVLGFGNDPTLANRAFALADRATSLSIKDQDKEWREQADRIYLDACRAGGSEWAADLGTFFHAVTEAEHKGVSWLTQVKHGIDLGLDQETVEAMLAVYHECIERHGLIVHGSEIRLVNDRFRVAGTTDLEVELTRPLAFVDLDGELITTLQPDPAEHVTTDLKTSRDIDPEHAQAFCTQLALYASAEFRFDTETEQRIPRPLPINQRWGLILWCPVVDALRGEARCDLVLVDLELGLQLATVAYEVNRLYERLDGFAFSPLRRVIDVESTEDESLSNEFTEAQDGDSLATVSDDTNTPGAPVEEDDPFDGLVPTSSGVIETNPRHRLEARPMGPARVPEVVLVPVPSELIESIRALPAEVFKRVERGCFMQGIDLEAILAGSVTEVQRLVLASLENNVDRALTMSAHERYGNEPGDAAETAGADEGAGMSWDQLEADTAMRSFIERLTASFLNAAAAAGRDEAKAEFYAEMKAAGIPPIKRATGHTNGQLRSVESTIGLLAWKHDLDLNVTPLIPVPRPGEGDQLPEDELKEAQAMYLGLDPLIRSRVDAWAAEAAELGVSVHMKDHPTQRRYLNLQVRVALASIEQEEMIRAALAFAVGATWPHMPSLPVGACIGALSIVEARCLLDVAHLLSDETPVRIDPVTKLTEIDLEAA